MNKIAFERNEDDLFEPVIWEDFKWEEIEPDDNDKDEVNEAKKEGFRLAFRAILDIIIPKQLGCKDPQDNLKSIGRKAVILAFATRHPSIETKQVEQLARLIGVRAVQVRKRLQSIRRKTGISKRVGTKSKD